MKVIKSTSLVGAHQTLWENQMVHAAIYPCTGWDNDPTRSIVLFRDSGKREGALSVLPDASSGCMLRWPCVRTSADPDTVIEMLAEEQAVV